ncbi:hypothetical protein ACEWY4_011651 [Coilia grayii]|uniref:DUF4590 domain-containing protein n=1 Tax=Coilia grayii TaxID=363190 RepID=A0ABD1JYE2_9TELE
MDDMTTLNHYGNMPPQQLLGKLQENIKWDGMKIKPNTSRSISILKWYNASLRDKGQLQQLRQDITNSLENINKTSLPGTPKLWCLQFGLLPQISLYSKELLELPIKSLTEDDGPISEKAIKESPKLQPESSPGYEFQAVPNPGQRCGGRGEKFSQPLYLHPLALDPYVMSRGFLLLDTPPLVVNDQALKARARRTSLLSQAGRPEERYLPSITGKLARGTLSQSCPYLASRRGSNASSTVQKTTSNVRKIPSRPKKEAQKADVTVTMVYTGQGLNKKAQDEVKVMQQICGGQNHRVFKGTLQPGEQFQFKSQRHVGFPFSATFYVNGIMAARISSCCEYRYTPGVLQGKKSCFKLTRLAGGKPCYRCVNARHVNMPQPPQPPPPPPQPIPKTDEAESRPTSPLFVPIGTVRSLPGLGAPSRDRNYTSTDSEELDARRVRPKAKRHKEHDGVRRDSRALEGLQVHMDENIPENRQMVRVNGSHVPENRPQISELAQVNGSHVPENRPQFSELVRKKQGGKAQKMEGESGSKTGAVGRDFFEECVELSSSLETFSNKKIWFKVHKQERIAVQERITQGPGVEESASELELSEESDSVDPDDQTGKCRNKSTAQEEEISIEELQKQQLEAVADVLKSSDEVDELVLRNTGMTDELLQSLVNALTLSPSTVSTINLNLNLIGPMGVHSLLELLHSKPQLQSLYLFGNRLGDSGVQMLLTGLADLQTSANKEAGEPAQPQAAQGTLTLPPVPRLGPPSVPLGLLELDLGGNGVGRDGLQVLATYMRYHSQLRYLALAQTSGADVTAWTVLFESLKANSKLTHVMLDECSLGDQGAKLFAETLRANAAIKKVDLDGNGIGDVGGGAILEALVSRKQSPLQHLSMEQGNFVSTALMAKILQEVQANAPAVPNVSLPLLPPTAVTQQ